VTPDELLDAHPGARVLTLDFFDTLVTRSVAQPTHVFALIEQVLRGSGDDRWRGFAVRRVTAERAARAVAERRGDGSDVTIEEIICHLAEDMGLSLADRALLVDLERQTELSVARPVRFGVEMLAGARSRGLRVAVVSDNYMPADHLVAMAHAVGIDISDLGVFVSCERGAMKHDGGLWPVVLSALGVVPAEILHVGDLADADGDIPARFGISAYVEDSMRRSHREPLNTAPSVLPLSRVEADNRDDAQGSRWDASMNLAQGALAVITAAQVQDVIAAARRSGAVGVHFTARDGENARHVYDSLRERDPSLPPATYTAVSRSMMWRASLGAVTPETVRRFIGDDELLTASRVARRFGCGFGEAADASTVLAAEEACDLVLAHAAEVEEASAALRARLLQYLDAQGVTAPGHHVVMDLGWTGSVVADLAGIVMAERPGTTFEGRFTALYWDATATRSRIPVHGLALDEFGSMDDNVRLLGAMRYLELLLSATHGTVVDYLNGEAVLARDGQMTCLHHGDIDAMHVEIRRSALRILSGDHPHVGPEHLTRDTVWASIMQVAHTPSPDEVRLMSVARHDTALDHSGDGAALLRAAPDDLRLEDIPALQQSLLHDNWAQGSLEAWTADPASRWIADEVRRHATMMDRRWVGQ
jgi:FMN phosphatase YigB (HAD superfamily)